MFSAAVLNELLKRHEIPLKQFAAEVHADRVTVWRWLSGEAEPLPEKLIQIARVTKAPPEALYIVRESDRTLDYYRVISGVSLRKLSRTLMISNNKLSKIERGETVPKQDMVQALTEHLGISEETIWKAWNLARDKRRSETQLTLPVAV